jgi:selenocysteine-specific elongation factor
MMAMVRHFEREETLTAAQFRDQLNTSRRYVLAFLEHLDAQGVTMREGDARKLRKK